MCDLCSDDPEVHKAARERDLWYAKALKNFARQIEENTDPHGEETKRMNVQVRDIVRYLVSDWL